jgi:uncharacterized membrane protein YfcA
MQQTLITPSLFPLFLLLLIVMAFTYASVGHGGASGYLAVLALFSMAPGIMKSSALILNIFVSLISFVQYSRNGHFKWRLFLPFALASIPASYIGASIPLSADIYKKVLGICLLFPILRLAGVFGKESEETRALKWEYGLAIGAIIGFLSGMIGIGGGIILSPVILLFHWAKMKETAAVSALFILVNSISGLAALISNGFTPNPEIYPWLAAAILGGFGGAYLGSTKFSRKVLRYILAGVLLVASIKLILS